MTKKQIETIEKLDRIDPIDCESAHAEADALLYWMAPPEVRAAYDRVRDRCDWWAYA